MSGSGSSNRQVAINLASSIALYGLNLVLSFFLTPYIISHIGTAAYGFVGLSNNIISYSSLLTVALSSMAGRFVSIKIHRGEKDEARIYMSSVFFANLVMMAFIMLLVIVATIYLQFLIRIPDNLVTDVKILFLTLGIGAVIQNATSLFYIAFYISNRLDIYNLRDLIGTVIRVVGLLLMFGLLVPRLSYIGYMSIISTVYLALSGYFISRRIVPDLYYNVKLFKWSYVKEVFVAGSWNILTRLGQVLSRGFDLLLANLFIGATAMGVLSITQMLPMIILGLFGVIAANFSPVLAKLYAANDYEGMKEDMLKSFRITGSLAAIPMAFLFVYSDLFYSVWLPTEDYRLLYLLSCVGALELMVCLPLEPLWNIFTITNRVKYSSVNVIVVNLAIIAGSLVMFIFVKDPIQRLFVLVGVRAFIGLVRSLTFLPRQGAKSIKLPVGTFYPMMARCTVTIVLLTGLTFLFRQAVELPPIISLLTGIVFIVIAGGGLSWTLLLKKTDRQMILNRLRRK